MTLAEKIEYPWNEKLAAALGAGEANPFDYADAAVAPLRAKLRIAEHRQAHPNGLPQRGSRSGRRQAAERRVARS